MFVFIIIALGCVGLVLHIDLNFGGALKRMLAYMHVHTRSRLPARN